MAIELSQLDGTNGFGLANQDGKQQHADLGVAGVPSEASISSLANNTLIRRNVLTNRLRARGDELSNGPSG